MLPMYAITCGKTRVSNTDYDIPFGEPPSNEYPAGTTLDDLSVGDTVFFAVGNTSHEFIIVHKGIPSSIYHESCDGVWLMSKLVLDSCKYSNTYNSVNFYRISTLHNYLDTVWVETLQERVKEAIIPVLIPYWEGNTSTGELATGDRGLHARAFALSCRELAHVSSPSTRPDSGVVLDYFTNNEKTKRQAMDISGTACAYWTRDQHMSSAGSAWWVTNEGLFGYGAVSSSTPYIRPAFVLPYDFEV